MTQTERNASTSCGIALIVFSVTGLITIAGYYLLKASVTPLGPSLQLPTSAIANLSPTAPISTVEAVPTPVAAVTQPTSGGPPAAAATSIPLTLATPTPPSTAVAASAPASSAGPVCGGPESLLVLGIGADSTTYQYGLADAIRIARLDFVEQKITIVSLPRDLWVEIPGLYPQYGTIQGKLNQAYFFGSPSLNYADDPTGGPGILALTIQHNFGLRVDHYAAINFEVFARIVDALGGVDIYLTEEVDDRDGSTGYYFPAGQHHMDGWGALMFARIRTRYSDYQRQQNQSLLIAALREKILSPSVLPRIPALIDAFKDQVLTDLSPEQILQTVCLLSKIEASEITQTQLPTELYFDSWTYSPNMGAVTSIVSADPQQISNYLSLFALGQWP